MSAISSALATKLTGDATLTALAPGGAWKDTAPEATNTTHIVYSLSSGHDEPQFGGTAWEQPIYLVKAVAPTDAAASAAAARIRALLDGGTLTIAGYTTMALRRVEPVEYVEVDGTLRYYHEGGLYELMACAA